MITSHESCLITPQDSTYEPASYAKELCNTCRHCHGPSTKVCYLSGSYTGGRSSSSFPTPPCIHHTCRTHVSASMLAIPQEPAGEEATATAKKAAQLLLPPPQAVQTRSALLRQNHTPVGDIPILPNLSSRSLCMLIAS